MSDTVVSFAPVEEHIALFHPDPEPDRQHRADVQGRLLAASWVAHLLGVDRRMVLRWRTNGLDYFVADWVATRLGVHPGRVWSDWWLLDLEPEQLGAAV